jgi:coproporphyrinogen III oxidase
LDTTRLKAYFTGLQSHIVSELEAFDGQSFRTDSWDRPEGGGGLSRLIEEGHFFERGGVNFSHVTGKSLPASATAVRPQLAGRSWEAMGVSLVLHPRNPYCPTAHMNVRCFVATKEGEEAVWWFGGGMDPYYGQREDVQHFHRTCRDALAPFGDTVLSQVQGVVRRVFLPQAPQRTARRRRRFRRFERRRLRALLRADPGGRRAFTQAYLPVLAKRPYGERSECFQAYRRSRYVEFNLVWDRGTLFGLQSGGRTRSILMSATPIVKWRYDWKPGGHAGSRALRRIPQAAGLGVKQR